MKVGERGQITIPGNIRKRHGLEPNVEVEIIEEGGRLILRKKRSVACPIDRFVGVLQASGKTDDIIEELRGR
jgi:AbrB family looped-hinge helix DNA binding protein